MSGRKWCRHHRGRYKQVAKSSRYLIYRFSYGKKLYFSSADDEELYDREPFTVEVGNTEDIDKIADILRELGETSKRSSTGTSDIPGVIFEYFLGM